MQDSLKAAARRLGFAGLMLALALGAIVVRGDTVRAGGVVIGDGSADGSDIFSPNTVTIAAGDTVTFTWVDGTHDARDAQSGAIYLPLSVASNSKTTTFATPGTYYFFCSVHAKAADATDANIASGAKQVGKIIVTAAAPPPPPPTAATTVAPAETPTAPPATTTPPAGSSATGTATPAGTQTTTPVAAGSSTPPAQASAPPAATKAAFLADISVSTDPAAPDTGTGFADENADPFPRWIEAVAVFIVIAALILTMTVRTMRRS